MFKIQKEFSNSHELYPIASAGGEGGRALSGPSTGPPKSLAVATYN